MKEFARESSWLKFGFHWIELNFHEEPDDYLISVCKRFYDFFDSIDPNLISTTLRLHYFYPCSESLLDKIQKLKWFSNGMTLLCTDTSKRLSYDLSLKESKLEKRYLCKNNRLYVTTDIRIESIDFSPLNIVPSVIKNFMRGKSLITIFTHEWAIDNKPLRLKRFNDIQSLKNLCYTKLNRIKMMGIIRYLNKRGYNFIDRIEDCNLR